MQKKNQGALGYVLILSAAVCSSLGQLAWKLGADASQLAVVIFWYILGFIAAAAGMVIMMVAFRFGEVSILQPMMSIGFAFSIFLGALFLSEKITTLKVIGVLLIVTGTFVLSYEPKKKTLEGDESA